MRTGGARRPDWVTGVVLIGGGVVAAGFGVFFLASGLWGLLRAIGGGVRNVGVGLSGFGARRWAFVALTVFGIVGLIAIIELLGRAYG